MGHDNFIVVNSLVQHRGGTPCVLFAYCITGAVQNPLSMENSATKVTLCMNIIHLNCSCRVDIELVSIQVFSNQLDYITMQINALNTPT